MPVSRLEIGIADPFAQPFLLVKENRFAHTAVRQLSSREGGRGPSLVYLQGAAGCGKTHMVKRFLADDPYVMQAAPYAITTGAEFAEDLGKAIDGDAVEEFRAAYSGLDLLVVEDLQGLEGMRNPQERLVHIVDDVLSLGGRVLFTSTLAPGELQGVVPRLVDRCRAGVNAAIEPLGRASRTSLLGHFASVRQIAVSLDVLKHLAKECPRSPRGLLSVLVQLDLMARENNVPIDRQLVARYLLRESPNHVVEMQTIATRVARTFEIPVAQVRNGDRSREHAVPRQCAMFLARELTEESLQSIAAYFGRKNHSTVLHACQRIKELERDDPALGQRLHALRRDLSGS